MNQIEQQKTESLQQESKSNAESEVVASTPKDTLSELLEKASSDSISQVEAIKNPKETKEMITGFMENFNEDDIKTLDKSGVEELSSVRSYSLKTIRHALSGFTTNNEISQSIYEKALPFLSEKSSNKNNYIDFFSIFKDLENSKDVSEAERKELYDAFEKYNYIRQRAIEKRGLEGASLKWKNSYDQMREAGAFSLKSLEAMFWEWNDSFQVVFKRELERIDEVLKYSSARKAADAMSKSENQDDVQDSLGLSASDRFEYGPYLSLVKPDKLGIITILELMKLSSTGGVQMGMKTAKAVLSVGKAVEMEYRVSKASKREENILGKSGVEQLTNVSSEVNEEIKGKGINAQISWPSHIRAKIGSLLIALLINVAKVTVKGIDPITKAAVKGKAPAFYHTYQYQNGTRLGVLKLHNSLSKYVSGDTPSNILHPQLLPMLVKPIPWTSYKTGGYLYSTNTVMRIKDAPEQMAYLKQASDNGHLTAVYDGLNVLGNTPWTVNTDVFNVITKVWNQNKEFLEIPRDPGELVLPPAPPKGADPQEIRNYRRECRRIHNEHSTSYSQRCDINYKLEIARAYLGERFYFPHNMDFRGRAYPLSPHLNHLGNDLSRSLLKFWNGRKLGSAGLRWLKIHTANVFGYDKFSFEEREQFINEHLEEIRDSALHPLDGKGWWQEGSDPWQTLAACIELNSALSCENPEEFVSHLPVHQDGTCNGLQHYAALGGDVEGARQVNLAPSDRPQDVYAKVLEIVQRLVNQDAEKGDPIAVLLKDQLARKVIKQTVMTTVYGVTFIGARAQIASQLKDKEGVSKENIFSCSIYITKKVFQAVRELFEGAHLIQDWLGDSATKIAKSIRLDIDSSNKKNGNRPDFMSSVIWTTPLGLPIVQPYRQLRKVQVTTKLQTVVLTDPYALRGVNARKQKTAFPPNYVHSLDASHMLLSASECGRQNLDFASVHDSYWTHAADIDKMNKILRDAFIELHQVDLVSQLKNEFEQRYGHMLEYVEIPRNSKVAQEVIEARQKLSAQLHAQQQAELEEAAANGKKLTTKAKKLRSKKSGLTFEEEIAIERRRLELLASDVPSEVEEGRAMVTPFSIIEKLSDEELKSLINQSQENKVKKQKPLNIKSSEHEGSGYDAQDIASQLEIDEDAEEAIDEIDDIDEESSTSTKATTIPTLDDSKKGTNLGVFVRLKIDPVPPKGDFDVRDLVKSKYFFC